MLAPLTSSEIHNVEGSRASVGPAESRDALDLDGEEGVRAGAAEVGAGGTCMPASLAVLEDHEGFGEGADVDFTESGDDLLCVASRFTFLENEGFSAGGGLGKGGFVEEVVETVVVELVHGNKDGIAGVGVNGDGDIGDVGGLGNAVERGALDMSVHDG